MRHAAALAVVRLAAVAVLLSATSARAGDGKPPEPAEPVLRVLAVRDLAPDAKSLASLVDDVKAAVGPGEDGASVVSPSPGVIVVRASPAAMKRVSELLKARRVRAVRPIVTFSMRVIRSDEAILAFGERAGANVVFARERLPALLDAIRSTSKVEVTAAPRISCFAGERARLSISKKVAYVRDFEIVTNARGTKIANPIVDTLVEGLVLDVLPTVAGGGVKVDVSGGVSVLRRPIATKELAVPGIPSKLTVQVPVVDVAETAARGLAIPSGKALYLSLGSATRSDGKGRDHYGVVIEVDAK